MPRMIIHYRPVRICVMTIDIELFVIRKFCCGMRRLRPGWGKRMIWHSSSLNDVRKRAGLEPLTGLSADDLAEAAYKEHGWEVAGYWVALVTRRADQFRMNRLKGTFEERAENTAVESRRRDSGKGVCRIYEQGVE